MPAAGRSARRTRPASPGAAGWRHREPGRALPATSGPAGVTYPGWWGEGEVKFYLDDDDQFPTICGTGTEDYFGGAYNWDVPGADYTTYCSPFLGMHQVIRPDGTYRAQQRFGIWHGPDPVHFATSLRVTVQDLGWRRDATTSPPPPSGTWTRQVAGPARPPLWTSWR